MRKLFLVALAASFLAVSAVPAMAIEPKFSGNYRIRGEAFNETTADKTEGAATYWDTRLRLKMDLAVSENLKAVYQLEVGDASLGAGMRANYGNLNGAGAGATSVGDSNTNLISDGQGRFTSGNGGPGTDAIDVETKHLYLDLIFPGTNLNLKTGLMPLKLGHGILLDNDFGAILLRAKADPVNISLFTFKTAEGTVSADDDIDFYGLSVDGNMGDKGSMGLYVVYGQTNSDVNAVAIAAAHGLAGANYDKYTGLWIGASADVNADALAVALEFDYYSHDLDGKAGTTDADGDGWLVYADIGANLGQAKAGIAGFYATGNDNDTVAPGDNDSERFMPILPASREDYAVLNWDNLFLLDGIGQYGANILSNLYSVKLYANMNPNDDLKAGISAQGYWKAEDVTASGKGNDGFYGYEVDLDVAYKIYEQLTYNVNAAWMFTNEDALGGTNATTSLSSTAGSTANTDVEDIWFIGHSLVYNF